MNAAIQEEGDTEEDAQGAEDDPLALDLSLNLTPGGTQAAGSQVCTAHRC